LDHAAQRRRLVAAEVVHDDDIAWLEHGNELLAKRIGLPRSCVALSRKLLAMGGAGSAGDVAYSLPVAKMGPASE
jgi:hypothetical protein